MTELNWTCPYCARIQTVTEKRMSTIEGWFRLGEHVLGPGLGIMSKAIACANKDCGQVSVTAYLGRDESLRPPFFPQKMISTHLLRPDSFAKPQPEFIPLQIRNDYEEACKIRDLSPKASATLSRRCIQGMIRDFCKISDRSLFVEIERLRADVTATSAPPGVSLESVEALHHIRTIGNIGAHMEADVNIIVDVEPQEAQALIDVTELLFAEWYVARKQREDRLNKVKEIADMKNYQRALET